MNEQLKSLIGLKEIDTRIRNEENQIKELTEKSMNLQDELAHILSDFNQKKEKFVADEKNLRSKERRLDEIDVHLKQLKEKIYQVKNAKEMEAIDEETAKAKKERAVLEEESLVLMESVENLSSQVKEDEKKFIQANSEATKEIEKCKILLEEANKKAEALKNEKNEIITKVDKAVLAEYERFFRLKGDFGVCEVKNGTCQGCNVNVSSKIESQIKDNNQLVRCENCARILYLGEENE